MKSYILLENVEIYAHHGVFEQETKVGNTFLINIKLKIDLTKPSLSDDLNDTISYAAVYDIMKREMDTPSKLLEHAGGRILRSLKSSFSQIEEIELRISKRNPPIGGQLDFATIVLID